jgi:hypothetical protein
VEKLCAFKCTKQEHLSGTLAWLSFSEFDLHASSNRTSHYAAIAVSVSSTYESVINWTGSL